MAYWVLVYYLDVAAFALLSIITACYADFWVLRQLARGWPRRRIWFCAVSLMLLGVSGALYVGNIQRERLRISIQGVAPTYAVALELLGHAKLRLDTPPNDPHYRSMIEQQKMWLASYPAITDIYTMRKLETGELVLLVDSETDYDHNGQYDDVREMRTEIGEVYPTPTDSMHRAFRGETVFDDVPVTDRWGTMVSAMTPMRDEQGRIEAIVGIDFAAEDWIRTLLLGRGCVLGVAMTFSIGLVVLFSVSRLQDAEIVSQRRYSEQLEQQTLVAQEALHKLKSYEFVLDTHTLLCVTDTKGRIVHANDKFAARIGYEREQILGSQIALLDAGQNSPAVRQSLVEAVRDGRVWHGELCNRNGQGESYWLDTTVVPHIDPSAQVSQFIAMATDITIKKRFEMELLRSARLDRLTGLPNRALLYERIKRAIARYRDTSEGSYAVMFLDFDRFKVINDTLGHEIGDLLLKEIARRLLSEVECTASIDFDADGNTVARLGGDEFVVLLSPVPDVHFAELIAERLVSALADPYQLNEHAVHTSASIGIAIGSPEHHSADDLLKDADRAMYAVKARGKNGYLTFDPRQVEADNTACETADCI